MTHHKRQLTHNMYLSEPEVRKLRRSCEDWAIADIQQHRTTGPRVWMIVDLALSTGLRVSELASLTLADIDLEGKLISVRRRKKRKLVVEYIGLPAKLADHLRCYWADRTEGPAVMGSGDVPLGSRGWQQAWLRACSKAGIRPLSIHKARHTAATVMYRSTHDLRLVQSQLGHADPATTAIYASISAEDLQAGAQALEDAMS